MQIAFFPWLSLSIGIKLGPLLVLPFKNEHGAILDAFLDVGSTLQQILTSYVRVDGTVVENCSVVTFPGRLPAWRIEDSDADLIARAAQILSISAIANNDYNTNVGNYANASMFQFFRQNFTLPLDFVTYGTRRRDGRTMTGGYRHGEVKFPMPLQAHGAERARVDQTLATSIMTAIDTSTPIGLRLPAVLSFFNLANTDSDFMQEDTEIILMGSTLEQLLNPSDRGAKQFALRVADTLKPYGRVLVKDALPGRPGIRMADPSKEEQWFVHQKWAEEFYHLRNEYIHGRIRRTTWGWHPLEHATMAAFVLSLLLKVLLQGEGIYSLSDDDDARLYAIDHLLAVTNWSKAKGTSHRTVWQETAWAIRRDFLLKKAITNAMEQLPPPESLSS